jgi:hypothetical protein
LLSLPSVAQGPISAALGRDTAAYRVKGLVARNPAQRFSARFGPSGVAITAGAARFTLSLTAFGRGRALTSLQAVSPVASANRVSYAYGSLREWWANGPLGLEQGFDIATRPAGSGVLALSLAVPGGVRLSHGTLLLPGGLRYAGVQATDADGRALHAWLTLRGAQAVLHVNDRGARYPLRIDPSIQQAELTASDGAGNGSGEDHGDRFGYSVAVAGNTVVVGAPFHTVGSNALQGAVYVFQMPGSGWASATQTAELTNGAGADHVQLGYSVAISSDGNTIVAGAPAGSEAPGSPTNSQGSADVFTTTGDNWTTTSTPKAVLSYNPADESPLGGELGWSVAISASGDTIVAGAPYDGSSSGDYVGVAYVYTTTSAPGTWASSSSPALLTASANSNENDGPELGASVSIAANGDTVVAGAPYQGTSAQGAVYVFTTSGSWTSEHQTAELTASDGGGSDLLGYSVAIGGNTIAAGAYNHASQGAAYVFVMPTGGWVNATQTAELTAGATGDEQGWSVAIDPSGDTIVAGARGASPCTALGTVENGAAYVYTEPAGGWVNTTQANELAASDPNNSDDFGVAVAVAVSGSTIVVGADQHPAGSKTADHGAAYIFTDGGVSTTNCGASTPTPTPTPAPAPTPTPTVTVPTAQVASVSGGHADITAAISCPAGGTACPQVSVQATVTEHLKGSKIKAISASGKKKPKPKTKQVVIATAATILAAGATKTITIKLNATGLTLLKKFGKLNAIVTVRSAGKTIDTVTVTVEKAAKPKKKKTARTAGGPLRRG